MDKNHYIIMAHKEGSALRVEHLQADWGGYSNIEMRLDEVNILCDESKVVSFSSGIWCDVIPYRVKMIQIIAGKFNNPDSILLDLKNAGWVITHAD